MLENLTYFVLAAFVGAEVISKVPQTLHTPLMSGSNAISGITIVGALVVAGMVGGVWAKWIGVAALIVATINVVGGYMVTDRMLQMFKKKDKPKLEAGTAETVNGQPAKAKAAV
ncbi:MAG TPA: NAD(P) transhydrogenase subunit alpha [Rhodothermales bacterium]|nr:NAD(P) transhydrogenase subunit alpha [Rhodothermales bacterium]